ncbi:PSME3-interacting protein isoform X2 [Halictus rubicundus]|uniref:PSME3-interacting protein isoform X2 n=1 Tax=Halictus rubicundus TaxID=77578 RepID=UPI0040362C77
MSSGFISEAEIAEQRRTRQQEWERVRTADQPLEVPEEPCDPRSLYERLQEQKNKRDAEYEEAHKLKNMIKGLDDDEVEFLDLVDRTKLEEERKKNLEEEKEIRDFKAAVASLQEKSLNDKLKQELKNPQIANKNVSSGSRTSQLKLLAGVVVKRSEKQKQGETTRGVKRKLSSDESKDSSVSNDSQENDQKTNENLECENSVLQDVTLQNKTVASDIVAQIQTKIRNQIIPNMISLVEKYKL